MRAGLRVSRSSTTTASGCPITASGFPDRSTQLPGVVVAANPAGKTTLVEFYDLNCPYCRIASGDIADMVAVDPELRLRAGALPVLGIASIAASRVELAVANLARRPQFYDFHREIYSQRGMTDGLRALEVAHGLGFDEAP